MINGSISVPIKENWIGLGSMDMYGIGFSTIRINSTSNKYTYKYGITNQAPEEVYLHEFLHTLERNCLEAGYLTPSLHDYEKYGYSVDHGEGLNKWYNDYMLGQIKDNTSGEYIGLNEFVFQSQPFNEDNFKYAIEIEL